MTAILRVDDVSKRFGGFLALSNVSCEVAEGRIHALIGPNGAGKSTLLNIISGVSRQQAGTWHSPDKHIPAAAPTQSIAWGSLETSSTFVCSRALRARECDGRQRCPDQCWDLE